MSVRKAWCDEKARLILAALSSDREQRHVEQQADSGDSREWTVSNPFGTGIVVDGPEMSLSEDLSVVPKSRAESAEQQQAKLREQLANLADLHHRTIAGSRLHDPEHIEDWQQCPARSCRAVAAALAATTEDPA
jgi:hypothetical protein